MTPDELLAIPVSQPGLVFPGFDTDAIDAKHKALRTLMHPDKGGTADAFAHLTKLYETAIAQVADGFSVAPGKLHIKDLDTNSTFEINYHHRDEFDLGEVFISDNYVVYAVRDEFADLYEHGVRMIRLIKYRDAAVQKEAERFMPKIKAEIRTLHRRILVIHKNPKTVRLSDLVRYLGGFETKHVAWVISRFCNIASFLHTNPLIVHGDMSLENYFVDPADHTGQLLGGWWFAHAEGQRLRVVSKRTDGLDVVRDTTRPIAESYMMNELVKATGRELLGDVRGSKLLANKALPLEMVQWLRQPAPASSVVMYAAWFDLIPKIFGKRKFHHLEVDITKVYAKPLA